MEENQSVFELQVDQTASKNLVDAARWARFIAIFCFVAMGCFLLLMIAFQSRITNQLSSFFPGTSDSGGFGILIGLLLFVFAIVSVVLVFLLRGASLIKRGIENRNQQELTDGLKSLKIYFAIYGVLAIIGVVFNLIGLISN
jgi:hypothetical protein